MAGADPRALVTGASSGIGAAFARALRARGERLVLVARRRARLAELSKELGGAEAAAVIPLDLTAPDAADRLLEEVGRRGMVVETLVNNAGMGLIGPFRDEPRERVLGMCDLDVRAVVALTHAFLPAMVERRRGTIINVASTAALQPIPYFAVYAAAKVFVLSFTEALATELRGTGVRVQALCPGVTRTEFLEVAGTHAVPVSRMPALSAERVVESSLRGLDRGRVRVVVGWSNRLVAFVQGFFPRSIVRAVAGELHRARPRRA